MLQVKSYNRFALLLGRVGVGLLLLLVGAAGAAAAQGCFSVGENTKVQFSQTNLSNPQTYNLFQWPDIEARLTDGERLLSQPEWAYLFAERTGAQYLYARATVNGMEGLVILPDRNTWVKPEGVNFDFDDADKGYATNRYDEEDWTLMENAGAIFLPADGYSVDGVQVLDDKRYGTYWTSSLYNQEQPFHIQFDLGYLYYENMHNVKTAYRSVRTVRPWEEPQDITNVDTHTKAVKIIRHGQLLIERDGKTYNAQGAQIK